mmetsp:Transcript_6860/g.19221  ORF Transcript_6860/g.19221 Transcript_6860/m.19221 type:complete len:210 (-) Transcript_6860:219-848(-)
MNATADCSAVRKYASSATSLEGCLKAATNSTLECSRGGFAMITANISSGRKSSADSGRATIPTSAIVRFSTSLMTWQAFRMQTILSRGALYLSMWCSSLTASSRSEGSTGGTPRFLNSTHARPLMCFCSFASSALSFGSVAKILGCRRLTRNFSKPSATFVRPSSSASAWKTTGALSESIQSWMPVRKWCILWAASTRRRPEGNLRTKS